MLSECIAFSVLLSTVPGIPASRALFVSPTCLWVYGGIVTGLSLGGQIIPAFFLKSWVPNSSSLLLSLRPKMSQSCEEKMGLLLKVIPFLKVVAFQLCMFFSIDSVPKAPSYLHFTFQNLWHFIIVITLHFTFAIEVCIFIFLNCHFILLFFWGRWHKFTHFIKVSKSSLYTPPESFCLILSVISSRTYTSKQYFSIK